MDDTPTEPLPTNTTITDLGSSPPPARPRRVWRLLAIGAGVVLVPASIAVAAAAGHGDRGSRSPASSTSHRDDAASTSTPTSTPDSTPDSTPTSVSTPDVTTPDV